MKPPEPERLVNDLLRDESYVAFRAGLYQDTLSEFRRHRGRRRRLRLFALAACLPFALCIFWFLVGPRTSGSRARQSAVVIVRSVPLTPGQVVTTADYLRDTVASRREHARLAVKAARIEIVHTPQTRAEEFLSDQRYSRAAPLRSSTPAPARST